MATQEVTQVPQQSSDESVRITEFLREELARQQVIADVECRDLKRLKQMGLPHEQAERRASNATAVLQYIGSTLRAYGDNRDFRGVQS